MMLSSSKLQGNKKYCHFSFYTYLDPLAFEVGENGPCYSWIRSSLYVKQCVVLYQAKGSDYVIKPNAVANKKAFRVIKNRVPIRFFCSVSNFDRVQDTR